MLLAHRYGAYHSSDIFHKPDGHFVRRVMRVLKDEVLNQNDVNGQHNNTVHSI